MEGTGEPLESELAFRDLTDAYEELQAERRSPVQVRRRFVEFLRASKRVPWIMEKELKRIAGSKGTYSEFWDSTPAAKACQLLRNLHEHELTLCLQANERFRSPLCEILGPAAPPGVIVTAIADGLKLDPFAEGLSPGVVLYPADPKTGAINLSRPVSRIRETRFVIEPSTEKVRKILAVAPTDDVHHLSSMCYSVLKGLVESHIRGLSHDE